MLSVAIAVAIAIAIASSGSLPTFSPAHSKLVVSVRRMCQVSV